MIDWQSEDIFLSENRARVRVHIATLETRDVSRGCFAAPLLTRPLRGHRSERKDKEQQLSVRPATCALRLLTKEESIQATQHVGLGLRIARINGREDPPRLLSSPG